LTLLVTVMRLRARRHERTHSTCRGGRRDGGIMSSQRRRRGSDHRITAIGRSNDGGNGSRR
jgi:hypothetical protein